MPSFKDEKGREWSISLNVTLGSKIKTDTGVDVFVIYRDGLVGLPEIIADPVRLGSVLYVACLDQCQQRSISADDFGSGLGGDALFDGGEAFTKALIDFFPNRAARPVLMEAMRKASQVKDLAAKASMEKLATVSPESLYETLKKSAGNGAASLEPTPAESPPANLP